MRKAQTHCCHRGDWQETLVFADNMQECLDHCPSCRSPGLHTRRATRLKKLAATTARPGATVAYRQHGQLPLKGLDSPYKWHQQKPPCRNTTRK